MPLRRIAVILAGLAAFALILYAFFALVPARTDPAGARAALQKSTDFLRQGNATAARSQALDAVRDDPQWGEAHAVLARALLKLGEGLAAEAELDRAVDAGYDPKRIPPMRAEALVLQGDAQRAFEILKQTDPQDRLYGLRIRARALTGLGNLTAAQAALAEAETLAPEDPNLWTDVGRFRFTIGDIAGAIGASKKAVELAPGSVDALVLRGELVRTQYGLIAALPWFEAALERDPWHHDTLIDYAATLGDAGRTIDMLAATRRALVARPGSAQAYYLQAVLAARAGNDDLARTLLQKSGDALADMPGALLLSATLDIRSGGYEQAIGSLRQLVGTQPMNITARKLLALALMRSDAARDSLDVLGPVVARGDADSYSLTLVARALERIGQRADSARFLDRAAYPARAEPAAFSADDSVDAAAPFAAEAPNNPDEVLPYIRALIDAGNRDRALAEVRRIARDNPGAPGAHVMLGDMLMLLDRPVEAAVAYQSAAAIRFDEPAMLRLVEAFDDAGNRADAAKTLALFLSQNPANIAALRLNGHWQLAAGEYDSAVDTLELLRARIGDNDAALNTELAQAYTALGNLDAAREAAETAYALAPSNPAAADAYGWTLYRAGDLDGARELLEKAARIAPDHAGIAAHLAEIRREAASAR